ncbi:MAG: proprotein convertase P-domain-containing protein [Rhodothermales bacterium]
MPALYRFTLLTACLLLATGPALAQQRAAERPATQRASDVLPLDRIARVEMPSVDNDALIARDEATAARATEPRPFRFAEPFEVALTTGSAGTWETLDDGTRVWRLVIASGDAYSINLGFSRFRLPDGAALWLYPAGEAPHFRAFTAADNEEHGELWSPIIRSDEVVVELNLPAAKPGAEPDFELELAQVNHAYRPFGVRIETPQDQARSGSCNVDVVCPEGNGFRDIIRSVGAYTRGGVDICSGSAMNTTAGDGSPYFLTADHCGNSAGNAPSVVIYWNYENSTCRPPGSPQSGGPGDGPLDQFSSGTIFLDTSGGGTSGGPDWTLLETDDPIPPEYSVFLNGWDRRDQATSSAIAIHHPQVEEKRISFENDPTSIDSYLGNPNNPANTHIKVTDWDLGTTEGGSSGSPLYSPEKRVIGQLSGGFASCTSQTADWYGRMARNMTTGLEVFLDPGNTGALFIDGAEAGNPPGPIQLLAAMDADPISVSPGGTTTISVEVFNNGTETGEAVTLENVLPDDLAFAGNLAASSGDASESDGTISWTVDVGDDGSETLSFDVTVDENAPGLPIVNTAVVNHPSLNLPLQPSVTIDVFVAPDFFYSNETGVPIPDNQCPSFSTSEIEVTDTFEPINMEVGVNMQHTWRGDLIIELTSPAGTTVRLLERVGGSADNLDALFSDSGPSNAFGSGNHDPAAPFYDVEGQTQGANVGPLALFLGEDPQGTWTLGVCDGAGQDVGSVGQWALLFYTENQPPVAMEDASAMAAAYRIDAAYPNPFAEESVVRFAVRDAQTVRAEVYDALGRRVQVLHDGPVAASAEQTLRIDGRGLAGGVYVVRFAGETFTASQKVLLVK